MSNSIMEGKVYHFKLSQPILEKMKVFSRMHQHDDKKDFREAYDEWYLSEKESIEREWNRLKSWGYDGDLKQKMYRSIRYYFSRRNNKRKEESSLKQKDTNTTSTTFSFSTTSPPQSLSKKTETYSREKRAYQRIPIEIQVLIYETISVNHDTKPSTLYKEFEDRHQEKMSHFTDEEKERIKKSFKNTHFNMKPNDMIQKDKLVQT